MVTENLEMTHDLICLCGTGVAEILLWYMQDMEDKSVLCRPPNVTEEVTFMYNNQSSLHKTMTPWGLGWPCLSPGRWGFDGWTDRQFAV